MDLEVHVFERGGGEHGRKEQRHSLVLFTCNRLSDSFSSLLIGGVATDAPSIAVGSSVCFLESSELFM